MSVLLKEECVLDVLNRFGGGVLKSGGHREPDWFDNFDGGEPPAPCEMCVEELRSLALFVCAGKPKRFTDHPEGDGQFEDICRRWNDGVRSEKLRTRLGIRLACRSTATAVSGWLERYRDRFCREVLSEVFNTVAEVVTDEHKQPMRDAAKLLVAEGLVATDQARKTARSAATATAAATAATDATDDAAAAYAAYAAAAAAAAADDAAAAAYAYAATAVADDAAATTAATAAAYAYAVYAAAYAYAADDNHNAIMEKCALILIECHDGTGL